MAAARASSAPATDPRHDAGEWFAIQVWTGRESATADHLRSRGYAVFVPRHVERRRWSDRLKCVERPTFPGYAFCRTTPEASGKIVTTPGVLRIVGDGRRPLPVAEHEIEAIRRLVESRLPIDKLPAFRPGQRMRIEAGPLRGIEGVVVTVKSGHRLVLSVSLLQRSVSVELDPAWVSSIRSV